MSLCHRTCLYFAPLQKLIIVFSLSLERSNNCERNMSAPEFREVTNEESAYSEQRELLSSKISELPLTIKESHLEALVLQLYEELDRARISFKPNVYLSDEWGCPDRVPVIAIPFYLVNPTISNLTRQLTGIKITDEATEIMLLRHEAGHAFNYAYHLYKTPGWRRLFGQFSQPYKAKYTPVPFSPKFVQHLPGWYAQRHPDDDFAETFAIWLTPDSEWQERYINTPALAKLVYVDKMARQYGQLRPDVTDGKLDKPIQELTMTLEEWIEKRRNSDGIKKKLKFGAQQNKPIL